jgi:hypothetical protein
MPKPTKWYDKRARLTTISSEKGGRQQERGRKARAARHETPENRGGWAKIRELDADFGVFRLAA